MTLDERALALLRANRRTTLGHQYTVPSPDFYPYQWLWDSCFHAIVLAAREPAAAKAELRSLLTKQFADGMVPHIIYWAPAANGAGGRVADIEWGVPGTSALTQPPMLAYAAWRIWQADGDRAFASEMYPALLRYYRYLIDKRDPRDHHLAGIINPDESGEDDSPRFDAVLHVPTGLSRASHLARRLELVDANRACNFDAELCMHRHFWVKDVPFNAILVENLRALAELAAVVGDAAGAHFASLNARLVAEAMRERLFDEAAGVYYSAVSITEYEPLKVATWAHFAPLFAGLYTAEEARAVVERYLFDPETFWSPHGVRTVAKSEAGYRPAPSDPDELGEGGFWRGPVWMAPHWFIYQGLARYGMLSAARRIRDASAALIEKSGYREYFDPETGEGYGAHDFTWGTLVLDMMES